MLALSNSGLHTAANAMSSANSESGNAGRVAAVSQMNGSSGNSSAQGNSQSAGKASKNGQGAGNSSANSAKGSGSGAGMGEDIGSDSRNLSSDPQYMESKEASAMKYGQYEKIYDPRYLNIEGKTSYVQGTAGEGPVQYFDTDDAAIMSESMRPYREVIAEYSEGVRQSLDRSPIPSEMQEIVKEYFSSLED